MAARKRNTLGEVLHDFQQFMYHRSQVSTHKKTFDNLGKKLKKVVDEKGVEQFDEDGNPGNIVYKFGQPVYIGETPYIGFEKRRSNPSTVFDEDKALELAAEKEFPPGEVISEVTLTMSHATYAKLWPAIQEHATGDSQFSITQEVDQNAFYRLQQRGKISEEELDSLLVLPEGAEPSYSFWPLPASDEDVED